VYPPGLRQSRHAHDRSGITVVIAGEIFEAAEVGEHRGCSGSVVMKPAGTEHEDRISGRGARTLAVEVRGGSPIEREIAGCAWSWFEDPSVIRAAVALRRAVDSGNAIEANAMALIDVILAMPGRRAGSPWWMSEVVRMLDERYADGIRIGAVAREIGLHPVYLSRAFRRHAGMPMTEYVRNRRLAEARHLLSASRRMVGAVAGESGFTDSSHLAHTFSRLLNVTPRAYRRLFGRVSCVQFPRGAAANVSA